MASMHVVFLFLEWERKKLGRRGSLASVKMNPLTQGFPHQCRRQPRELSVDKVDPLYGEGRNRATTFGWGMKNTARQASIKFCS